MWTFIKPQHSWAETHVTLPYCSDLRSFRHIYFKRPPTLNMHKHVSCHTCAHSFHHKILFLTPCLIPVNCNNLCHIDSPHKLCPFEFFSLCLWLQCFHWPNRSAIFGYIILFMFGPMCANTPHISLPSISSVVIIVSTSGRDVATMK